MTKSPIALAKMALRIAKAGLDTYSSLYSRQDYTQHQLFAILVLRQFHKADYRGIIQMLKDYSDLRKVLGLKKVPHYSTLCYAEKRLLKKKAFENLLNAIFDQAETIGLLQEKKTAAVDATGLESRHTSRYYVRRRGYKRFSRHHWPKITAVCDTGTHLFAGCIVTHGPSNDSPQFAPAVIQASKFVQFDLLIADAAYDGEHNHRLCREQLGIVETIIPLNKRRSRKWPKSKYRRQMKEHFDKEQFNQRWQIESAFSRNKRLLGSALRARTDTSRERECFLRMLTHNLMIIRRAA